MQENNSLCPCHSRKTYFQCCKIFHDGKLPPTALDLMRSRYSAYALRLPQYIIDTTHPDHIDFGKKETREIEHFCNTTQFENLVIVEFDAGEFVATVTFTAHLRQNGKEFAFTEKSWFEKVDGQWLYKKGEILHG
ncbi:MAG: hypothetical protein JSR58_07185 [Verrucomicrobia bacterium]|nr:hypothetical protein [Verrucomicrobiota bacterium]